MNVYQITESFGLKNLRKAKREERPLGEHEIRMQVSAVSLNYRDLLMVQGKYNSKQPLPLIPCSDGAGVICEIGSAVRDWQIGDAITTCFFSDYQEGQPTKEKLASSLGGPLEGTLRERIILSEKGIVRQPKGWTHAESATLPCAALTAWKGLHAGKGPAERVLIQGTGGVSIAALQLAKSLGMTVIMTSSCDEKLKRAKALGADFLINYRSQPAWGKEVKKLTNGIGVDLIIEVGGANSLKESLIAIRPGGTISMIGILGGTHSKLNLIPVLMQQVRIQGIIVGSQKNHKDLIRHLDTTSIRPVISDRFSFDDIIPAFEHLRSAKHFGKIVII